MSWPNSCLRRHILMTSILPRILSRHIFFFLLCLASSDHLPLHKKCYQHFQHAHSIHCTCFKTQITHRLYWVKTSTGHSGPICRSQLQFNWSMSHFIPSIFSKELRIYHDYSELTSFFFPLSLPAQMESFLMPRSDRKRPLHVQFSTQF